MAYNYANIGPIFFPVAGYGTSALGKGSQIGHTRSNIGGGTHRHKGHDIFAPEGTPLVAPVSGRIVNVGLSTSPGSKLGYRVTIQDARGNRHILAHMMNDPSKSLGLRVGQQVTAGQHVGFIGRTEAGGRRTTVPHVHYSINEGRSNLVDPYEFLKGTRVQTANPNSFGGSRIGQQIIAGAAASRSYNTPMGVAQAAYQAGFRGQALNMAIAIAQGESGFRPDARGDISKQNNKWGASIGLWQIRSLKAETGKGTSRDANRLTDPLFNARAAFEISKGGTDFSPWSVYTSGKYRQYMAEAEQTVSAAGGEVALNSDITGSEAEDLIRESQIAQFAGFMGVPGVADIIARFTRGEIKITEAKNLIMGLPWWRTTSETKRALDALKQTDPATYDEKVRAKAEELIKEYANAGVTPPFESLIDVFGGEIKRDSALYQMAEKYLLGNFSTTMISQFIFGETPPNEIGALAETVEDMAAIAGDYFVKYSANDLQGMAMRVLRGEYTTDKFLLDTQNTSKRNFAHDQTILDAMDRGVTPRTLFSTHTNSIANMLNVDEDSIDYTSPEFNPVLDFIDKDTNKRRSMTNMEAGRYARTLPQFRTSQTAMNDVASFLKDFAGSMVR